MGRKLKRTQPAWSRSETRPEGQALLAMAQTMESETEDELVRVDFADDRAAGEGERRAAGRGRGLRRSGAE